VLAYAGSPKTTPRILWEACAIGSRILAACSNPPLSSILPAHFLVELHAGALRYYYCVREDC
jgi:hypothetical protein